MARSAFGSAKSQDERRGQEQQLCLCGTPSNETVPRGDGFLCAILKFHASGKYAKGVAVEFNHYAGRDAASRSVHATLLPA